MAVERRKNYWSESSAAYDMYSSRALPMERPSQLPEEQTVPKRRQKSKQRQKTKQKAKLAIAPFALAGMAVAVCLLLMVINGYVKLYEASSAVGDLNDQLAAAEEDNAKLLAAYEGGIDLTMIELQAKQLGLKQPNSNQTVYLNVAGEDKAVVLQTEEEGLLRKTWTALKEGFAGIVAYFS